MKTKRRILVFGDSQLLRRLAAELSDSPLLKVVELNICDQITAIGNFHPHVIVVDGAQIIPEQFAWLLNTASSSRSTLISIDPLTY